VAADQEKQPVRRFSRPVQNFPSAQVPIAHLRGQLGRDGSRRTRREERANEELVLDASQGRLIRHDRAPG
jgi:hypothetical protein